MAPAVRTIAAQLAELKSRSLFRRLREIHSPQQPAVEFSGQRVINFSSNDYLGLASEPALNEAAKKAIDEFGLGTGASRLVCGTLSPHVRLENALSEFKGTEAALTFSSGYAAAMGTIGALVSKEDVVVLDKLCHASLVDGARLSGAIIRVFAHNHMGKLESHLEWARENYPEARVLVVTESIFSMDGDAAPLREMVEIKKRYRAWLLVDEAHATGVVGPQGRGLAEELGVSKKVEVQMGTLSKALGVSGGFVCGSRRLIDLLVNRARSFMFSTAPPPALAAAGCAALEFVTAAAGEERRQLLVRNLQQFARELPSFLPKWTPGKGAIIPLLIGAEEAAMEAASALADKGFLVPAIRYPTVARGTSRLRVTLSARHTPEQITRFCLALKGLKPFFVPAR